MLPGELAGTLVGSQSYMSSGSDLLASEEWTPWARLRCGLLIGSTALAIETGSDASLLHNAYARLTETLQRRLVSIELGQGMTRPGWTLER